MFYLNIRIMKKVLFSVIGLFSIIFVSISQNSVDNNITLFDIQNANAICQEIAGDSGYWVCCYYGGDGCNNAVNDENYGPFYPNY